MTTSTDTRTQAERDAAEVRTHRRDAILSSYARKARRRLRRLAIHFALLRRVR